MKENQKMRKVKITIKFEYKGEYHNERVFYADSIMECKHLMNALEFIDEFYSGKKFIVEFEYIEEK